MPRRPTGPRYYPSRRAFYAQVGGKQVLLAKGDQDDPEVLQRAWERFRELVPARKSKVVAITEEECRQLRRKVIEMYRKLRRKTLPDPIDVTYDTGCTPAEACALSAADLDLDTKSLRIGGRLVPCEECLPWLMKRATENPTGPLLRNRRGQPWTVDALHGAWTRLRDRLGLRPELTPFSWRHAFAVRFLEKGGSITDLAAILGICEKQARKLYGP